MKLGILGEEIQEAESHAFVSNLVSLAAWLIYGKMDINDDGFINTGYNWRISICVVWK